MKLSIHNLKPHRLQNFHIYFKIERRYDIMPQQTNVISWYRINLDHVLNLKDWNGGSMSSIISTDKLPKAKKAANEIVLRYPYAIATISKCDGTLHKDKTMSSFKHEECTPIFELQWSNKQQKVLMELLKK